MKQAESFTVHNCSFAFCSDPGLFVYCCDFSSTAVELVKVRWLGYCNNDVLIRTHPWDCGLTAELKLPSCHQTNPEYDPERCFAFVHDLSDVEANYPVPDGTLDVIVLIFVLSALHPDKYELFLCPPSLPLFFFFFASTQWMSKKHCIGFHPSQDAGIHQ